MTGVRAEPESLAALIAGQAARASDSVFLEDARSDRTLTYGGLAALVAERAAALEDHSGPVFLTVRDPLDLAAALLGTVASGHRAVALDPETPDQGIAAIAARFTDEGASRGGSSILFTSGSSGTPKGVELPEAQLLFVARQVAANNALTPADRGFNPLPLFHVNAQVVALMATLVAGSTLVLDRRFSRTGFWDLLQERRITWLNAVPAILAVLARSGPISTPDGLRFIRSASAPLPDPVRAAFAGHPFVVSWGMTEGASQITATPPTTVPPPTGGVGMPLGGEVQARDDDGVVLAAGERGELWIRGPGIVRSYLFGQAADRFDAAGWLRTGDAGFVQADGSVVIVGRMDDVINRGGELVDPAEVEAVLLRDLRVREAVVVGRPDDVLGEVPVAYAIAAEPESTDVDALIAALTALAADHLPPSKRPKAFTIVADLPRSAAGKILRKQVLAAAAPVADA